MRWDKNLGREIWGLGFGIAYRDVQSGRNLRRDTSQATHSATLRAGYPRYAATLRDAVK